MGYQNDRIAKTLRPWTLYVPVIIEIEHQKRVARILPDVFFQSEQWKTKALLTCNEMLVKN